MIRKSFYFKFCGILVFTLAFFTLAFSQIPKSLSATIEYEYDDLGRLIAVVLSNTDRIDYTYDDAGNRLTKDIDNSGLGWPVEFIVEGGVKYEGSQITFTITKLGTVSQSHSVDYDTFGDSATEGADYTGASNTLTFTTSETEKTVNISTTSDTDVEGIEEFFFDLSNPTGGADVAVSRASGYIISGDEPNSPPVARIFNVFIAWPTPQDVCVTCNADPDGDEATVKSVSASGGITATITTDDKKITVSGSQGAQGTVNYTIEDPSGGEDSSVINVEVSEGSQ